MSARRIGGWLVALLALAALGWWAYHPSRLATASQVVLLTADWQEAPPKGVPAYRLPDARTHPGAQWVPDLATLRRLLPTLETVEIRGAGVDPSSAAELDGLQVTWPDQGATRAGLEVIALACPREVAVGEPVRVSGRLDGLAAGAKVAVVLEEPDGHSGRVEVVADERGAATFAVTGRPTRAAGRFLWRLRVGEGPASPPLGVSVIAATRPRVLLIQDAPSWELARLHEWLVRGGHAAALRTRVSAERWRWADGVGGGPEAPVLAPKLLAGFELVVASEEAVVALGTDERRALTAAIQDEGLGLLVVGEPAVARSPSGLLPWEIQLERTEPAEAVRATRLRTVSGRVWPEPIGLWAARGPIRPLQRELARDPQGRVVVVHEPLGRGWIGRSLIAESWRWLLAGHDADYAALWSEILGSLAKPKSLAGGWRPQSDDGLFIVGRAVDIIWTGVAGQEPPVARWRVPGAATSIDLHPTGWPGRPGEAWTRWWPAQPGWHRLESDAGGLDCHVIALGDWPGMQRAQRRAATLALVEGSVSAGVKSRVVATSDDSLRWRWLAWFVFVGVVGALWWRERRRR